LDGDVAVIGADWANPGGGRPEAGSAYVFVRSGGVWTQQARLTSPDGSAFDHFGFAVAVGGSIAVVGALSDDTEAGTDAGSAEVYVI
jgi:hypothetical protein